MAFAAAFFDLDGTLVDNFTAVHVSCNLTLRDLGLPEIPYAKVRSTVGGSIVLTMQRLAGEEKAPEAVRLYSGHFAEHWADGLCAMPGAAWLLAELGKNGVRRAVLTNKNEVFSRKIMEHLGLGALVEEVIGTSEEGAAGGFRKPRADFTFSALKRLGARAEESVLIGDSPFDAGAGLNAGLSTHLVATGSHSAAELAALGVPVHADLYALGREAFGLEPPAGSQETSTR